MLIYQAALEVTESYYPIVEGLIENGFFSFMYLRKRKTIPLNLEICKSCGMKNIVIDSGAHSFFVQSDSIKAATNHVAKNKVKETPEEYFDQYIKWVKEFWYYFDYFVELDIGEIIGQERVNEWREFMRKEGLYKKCIPVFHPATMSFEDYIEMLETADSGYVGIEGIRDPSFILPYNKYIKEAYIRGVKIHGFAMTKRDVMEKYPFYSVDSNSWKAGVMYGAGLKVIDDKVDTVRYRNAKSFARTSGKIDINVIFGEDRSRQAAVIFVESSKAYKHMQEYYTKLWTKRGIIWK